MRNFLSFIGLIVLTNLALAEKPIDLFSPKKRPDPQTPVIPVNPVTPVIPVGPPILDPNIPLKPGRDRITNIGNGGGLAEMRLIYLHQNLDRFLKICLTADNVCKLSSQTLTEWHNLVQRQAKDGDDYIISFVPIIANQAGYKVVGSQLTVASQSLYQGLETPKQFGELLAYIIAVRQDLAGSQRSFAENLIIATSVFKVMKVEESLYRASGLPALIRIAQLKVFDGTNKHFLFSIEDKDKTIDLTSKITSVLPCGEISNWNFSQWNSSISSTGYFYGYANGVCDGQSVQKRIVIQIAVSSAYIIDESKVSVQFFAN